MFTKFTNLKMYRVYTLDNNSITVRMRYLHTRSLPKQSSRPAPAMKVLTEEETENIMKSSSFCQFFERCSRIIERSLDGDDDCMMMYSKDESHDNNGFAASSHTHTITVHLITT